MRKKIILLAFIAGMVILTTFSFLIAKEIEKNKQQRKRTVKFINQEEPINVLENKQLEKINQNNKQKKGIIEYKQKTVKSINQEDPENPQIKEEPKDFQDEQKQKEIDTSDWEIYRNERYGFTLRFPNLWKGYEVDSGEKSVLNYDFEQYSYKFVYFICPQKVSNKSGYGKVDFIIGLFDKENWSLAQGWKSIGQKGDNICGYCRGNGEVPDGMYERSEEIKLIISTFEILP